MAVMPWDEVYELVCRHGALPGADLCAVAAADAESGRDPLCPPGDQGQSWGLWQMHTGGGEGQGHAPADLQDPDYAAAIMVPIFNRNYCGGQEEGLHGEQLVRYCCMWTERPYGTPDLYCRACDHYWESWKEAVTELGGVPTAPIYDSTAAPVYNAAFPPEPQNTDWSCSIATSTWMLNSIGQHRSEQEMMDLMVPDLVTPALGLLNGSGADLAPFLGAQSGLPYGNAWLDWETTCGLAGKGPIGMGSGRMYHWLAVRARAEAGHLLLMNPAVGYRGVGDVLTEDEFRYWGPWAVVWLVVGEDSTVIAELEAQVTALEAELAAEKSWGTAMLEHVIVPSYNWLTEALRAEPVTRTPVEQAHTLLGNNGGRGQ